MHHDRTVSSLTALPSFSFSSPSSSSRPAHTITSQQQSSLASVPYGRYQDYSRAFSENTAYDNSPIPSAAPSLLSYSTKSGSLSRPIDTLKAKLLDVLSDSVKPSPTSPGVSRTRSLHQRAISLASFIPSLPASDVEEHEGRSYSSRSTRALGPHSAADRLGRPTSAHFERSRVEDQEYDNPIMDYQSCLSGGDRPARNVRKAQSSEQVASTTLAQASFRKWFGGGGPKRGPVPWSKDSSSKQMDLHQSAMSLLCPNGDPNLQDSAALSDFLKNAEALVIRLQNTCKEQEAAMRAARIEREVATEEANEADTRARYLRKQLEEMSRKATEKQMACSSLAEELALERLRSAEDTDRAHRVCNTTSGETETRHRTSRYLSRPSADESKSVISIASDSGFESDYPDTETDGTNEPMSPVCKSPIQRIQRWSASSADYSGRPGSSGSSREGARQVDSAVWSWTQQEKRRLERRVQELEGIVESCLDLVSHV